MNTRIYRGRGLFGQNDKCPVCGAEIRPFQQECLNCRVYLLEVV